MNDIKREGLTQIKVENSFFYSIEVSIGYYDKLIVSFAFDLNIN
jgi:hypothetical protein